MTDWYGGEGKAYPVQPGEVWHVAGHVYQCGDLRDYKPPLNPQLTYCDPPWTNGLLKSFHTKAGYAAPPYDYLDLYKLIIEKAVTAPVWLEGGMKEADAIMRLLPGQVVARWDITYYGDRPAALFYSGQDQPWCDPLGMDDADIPQFVLERHPSRGLVCDPCAGRGLTALAAERAGWLSTNNELNPARVSAAMVRMSKLTGKEPGRVG